MVSAAGKGVVVAMTLEEAHAAVDFMLVDNKFGVQHNEGGARVVIEEFLRRRRGQLHRAGRWQKRLRPGHQPGPQAPERRR